jgi:flavin-dependent dehydrogenase
VAYKKAVLIVGGGLAGLVAAIHLTRSGVHCTVFEKRSYPFHRVCGEYISNEVVPYLTSLEVYPKALKPSNISQFQLTSVNGKSAFLPLDLGGFGISRYQFDHFLYQQAVRLGVEFHLDTEVEEILFQDETFSVKASGKIYNADVVAGCFGKRSRLDVQLNRSFIQKRSPYVGVKYHIRLEDFPGNLIALHNFKDGYCGISHVESDKLNLCYLTHRNNLKIHGSIAVMEQEVLHRNPFLKEIFSRAEFLFDKPEVINEISFQTKGPVERHVLMTGDAAGMITPLCGNGMAMAIHSSKLLSELVLRFCHGNAYSRARLEADYAASWNRLFASRLRAGRLIQQFFGNEWTSNLAVGLAQHSKPIANFLMSKTHGLPFDLTPTAKNQ